MTLFNFKLAAISEDDFTDDQMETAFLNLVISSEDELEESLGILQKYRPKVYQTVGEKYLPLIRR